MNRQTPVGSSSKRLASYAHAAIPAAVIAVALCDMTVGFPRWATDWFFRPQFMQGCTLRSRLDDDTLRLCNVAYDRYRAVVAKGYRPLGDQTAHPPLPGKDP